MYVGNLGSRFEKLLFFTRIPLLLVSRVVVFTRYSEREVGQQWHIPTERVISSSIGVDVTKYSDIRSSSNFYRAELGVSRDDRVILVVARLHPEKDVELAIRAALALNDPGTLLLIVGDGQERNRLEQLVAELPGGTRIRFLGLMQDPRPAYAAADILLQTSRSPNLGTVVLEAMASGLPVVIAYRDSSEFLMALDTFDGDDIGVIAEATADDLARAISTLSADPGKIEKLRTRVHNFVEVRHAQEVVYSKLLDDYTYLENLTH
jgi:glycosyltransferase involved in cell wall biosynthesis